MSYLLPLGPFERGWRGPQRIVLHVDGERIADIEDSPKLHARGCAERLSRLPLKQCYPLVNRVCGLHSHHHAWAWTMALEQLAGIDVSPRADVLRALLAEVERIASHVGEAARVFALLGLDTDFRRLLRWRELALEAAKTLTGQRLVHDFVRPGGVEHDLHGDERMALHALLVTIATEVQTFVRALPRRVGIVRRTRGLGVVTPALMTGRGIEGWLARAAGRDRDIRRDHPYGIYQHGHPAIVVHGDGDVHARLLTLLAEAYESAEFGRRLLHELPEGRWRGDLLEALPPGAAAVHVEAPSGMLTYRLTSDGERLTEIAMTLAQRVDRPLLKAALAQGFVDDATLVVASLAFCTACAEA